MIGVKDFNMGFVPEDAEWYLAEIVQELTVEDDPRNMIWRNLTLVKADSPDHAYERALEMGQAGNIQYPNPDGKLVTTRFQGLSFMDVIHDPLEDGAELMFSSQTSIEPEELRSLLCSKEELPLFRPRKRLDGPDVASGDIVLQLKEEFSIDRPGDC